MASIHEPWRRVGLLDLPLEIIAEILQDLPIESVEVCMKVHSILESVILQPSFLNDLTAKVLGLRAEDGVKFLDLPQTVSPAMELWYLTNSSLTRYVNISERLAASVPVDSSLGDVDSQHGSPLHTLLFPLSCLKHLLKTWAAEARLPVEIHSYYINNYSKSRLLPCEAMSKSNILLSLPRQVSRVLINLEVAWPGFLERTMFSHILSLIGGAPTTMAGVWEVAVLPKILTAKPDYSLEIVFTDRPNCDGNAMMILFFPESCVFWLGTVAASLMYKHKQTLVLGTAYSLSTIRQIGDALKGEACLAFKTAEMHELCNQNWALKKMYPGACHSIHHRERKDLLKDVDDGLEKLVASIKLWFFCIEKYSTNKHNLNFVISELQTELRRTCLQKIHHVSRLFGLQDSFNLKIFEGMVQSGKSGTDIMQHSPSGEELLVKLRACLQRMFRKEAQRFFQDRHAHIIMCDSCSKLWFPKGATLDHCIENTLKETELHSSFWPFHLLVEALDLIQTALNV